MPPDEKISIREHFEAILEERDKALKLANQVIDERLDHMNMFREQVLAERALFVRRDSCVMEHKNLDQRFATLEGKMSNMEGRWLATVAVLTLIFMASSAGLGLMIWVNG